jgi:hypothetical protein
MDEQMIEATEEVAPQPVKNGRHTHGPNFGRFVAGCPQCEKVGPKPKVKAIRPVADSDPEPTTAPQGVFLTFEQLQELMAKQSQTTNQDGLAKP